MNLSEYDRLSGILSSVFYKNEYPVSNTPPSKKGPLAVDFKSATLYALRVVLHSHKLEEQIHAINQRMNDAGSFFEDEPVVIDATNVDAPVEWAALAKALRQHSLHPIGVLGNDDNLALASKYGLHPVDLSTAPARPAAPQVADKDVPVVAPAAPAPEAAPQAPGTPSAAPQPDVAPAAMVINRPLRSGQRVYARNTDLIVIGVVSQGAEVIADGNIHVYGPLRGKAMAGARGDTSARIFTTQLDPELIAIAGVYRVIETKLEPSLHNKPTLIQLEGETLQIRPLGQ